MPGISGQQPEFFTSADLLNYELPIWVFYLLVSIILLLLSLNFLMKKELRHRINHILSTPQRRFARLRLKLLIGLEENRKKALFRRLGAIGSVYRWEFPGIDKISDELKALQKKSKQLEAEWHRHYKELQRLKEEKQKLLASPSADEALDSQLSLLDEKISQLEKTLAGIQNDLLSVDRTLEPHYQTIGQQIHQIRPENEEMAFICFQIDSLEKRITQLKEKLEKL